MIKKLLPLLLKQSHLVFFGIFLASLNILPYIKLIFIILSGSNYEEVRLMALLLLDVCKLCKLVVDIGVVIVAVEQLAACALCEYFYGETCVCIGSEVYA